MRQELVPDANVRHRPLLLQKINELVDVRTGLKGMEIKADDLAIVYTIANAVGPITMISGGWFNDRLGPKKVIALGALCPAGYVPAGFTPPKKQNVSGDMDWKAMIKTPVFYIMLLLLTSGAFSGMMVISQAYAVAQNMIRMSAIAASAAGILLSFLYRKVNPK